MMNTMQNLFKVNGIQSDDRLFIHTQCRCSIDPVTFPTRLTQCWVDLFGITTALAGNDSIKLLEALNVERIVQHACIFTKIRGRNTNLRCTEENRFNQIKIALFYHALHEDRTDHATPTY
ncbi:Uncharacterised protein [Vibrio cholerae]|uniref:Uncharacterized protein n=1 Tax=Vibrio cholerae TaxID=666 RepID=A0A656AZ97_VIBCL|nr:Uncharacterised protein [Vibrio cholerae]CRZ79373.1 Uncharacterised protein [Vibrio cholerae]CRZ94297.1 Uncharacterised protein [Vibrio cholerae]CSB20999.1 Uncharacterised protein [Vibrio cholerae]CSB32784.1 Uncharacterised protein [Vibrio cholerae]